jgi:hypothetical protein
MQNRAMVWIAAGMTLVSACTAAPVVDTAPVADGQRVTVPIGTLNQVSLEPPKGARRLDPQTWLWSSGPDQAVVLRVQQNPEPEGGTTAYVDRQLAVIHEGGDAGVERDERMQLGDLEARRVHAVELRKQPPAALWLVIATAEDGMFVISAAGPRDLLRTRSRELDAFLASVRILPPAAAERVAAPYAAPADDIAPPAAVSATDGSEGSAP